MQWILGAVQRTPRAKFGCLLYSLERCIQLGYYDSFSRKQSRVSSRITPLCRPISSQRCYSATSGGVSITLNNVFSNSNKKRVQEHFLLSAKHRRKKSSEAKFAVLVPLCTVRGEPSVLFTLRSTSLRKHRGQVSFPGGKVDDTDKDFVHTALRETEEELGIPAEKFDVWGTMQEFPSRDKTFVVPVIGYCGEVDIDQLTLSEDEVEDVFIRSVVSLCDERNIRYTQFRNGYTLPVYVQEGQPHIWGLTSTILHQTLTIIAPGLYKYKLMIL